MYTHAPFFSHAKCIAGSSFALFPFLSFAGTNILPSTLINSRSGVILTQSMRHIDDLRSHSFAFQSFCCCSFLNRFQFVLHSDGDRLLNCIFFCSIARVVLQEKSEAKIYKSNANNVLDAFQSCSRVRSTYLLLRSVSVCVFCERRCWSWSAKYIFFQIDLHIFSHRTV